MQLHVVLSRLVRSLAAILQWRREVMDHGTLLFTCRRDNASSQHFCHLFASHLHVSLRRVSLAGRLVVQILSVFARIGSFHAERCERQGASKPSAGEGDHTNGRFLRHSRLAKHCCTLRSLCGGISSRFASGTSRTLCSCSIPCVGASDALPDFSLCAVLSSTSA